jgi:hypothetical protein
VIGDHAASRATRENDRTRGERRGKGAPRRAPLCARYQHHAGSILAGLQRQHADPPLPLRGKIAANSSNWEHAVFLQYDQSKVKAADFAGDARPRPRQDAGSPAKAYDASCGGYE